MPLSNYLTANKEIIEELKTIPTLQSFSHDDLTGLSKMSRVIECNQGELIIEEGQFDNWIYFLLNGKVGIMKEGNILSTLQDKGDMFGEMGIIDGSPRSASILAIENALILGIDASYMDNLEGQEKTVFSSILYKLFAEILSARLRATDKELVQLKSENEKMRLELNKLKK